MKVCLQEDVCFAKAWKCLEEKERKNILDLERKTRKKDLNQVVHLPKEKRKRWTWHEVDIDIGGKGKGKKKSGEVDVDVEVGGGKAKEKVGLTLR